MAASSHTGTRTVFKVFAFGNSELKMQPRVFLELCWCVSRAAEDGAILRAWYIQPINDNGRDVVMCMASPTIVKEWPDSAPMILQKGYRVLLPDSRAHGDSGGAIATYGLLEREDIHLWVNWLYSDKSSHCVYGFGESMGAALVVQALAVEKRFCAIVANSAFSNFRAVAYDRVGYYVHLGRWFGQTVGRFTG